MINNIPPLTFSGPLLQSHHEISYRKTDTWDVNSSTGQMDSVQRWSKGDHEVSIQTWFSAFLNIITSWNVAVWAPLEILALWYPADLQWKKKKPQENSSKKCWILLKGTRTDCRQKWLSENFFKIWACNGCRQDRRLWVSGCPQLKSGFSGKVHPALWMMTLAA